MADESTQSITIAAAPASVLDVIADFPSYPEWADSITSAKVKATLVEAKDMQANAIKVVTDRNVVYLMGRVTEREANRAAEVARSVSGVAKVVRVFELISEEELAGLNAKPPAAASAPKP